MEILEKIVIVEFDLISNAIDYMEESGNSFAFKVEDNIYSGSGVILSSPDSFEDVLFGDIWLGGISEKSLPGSLYIEDGFLKYYKVNE